MARSSKTNNRHKINAKTYDKIRKDAANANRGMNNGMWGKKRTGEECLKISQGIANSEKAAARTYILSAEHKKKISDSKLNSGFIHSQETKIEWSRKRKGRPGQDNNSGKKWFNNGVRSFLSRECPPDCVSGRLPY
jgi:hypothetical protein